MLKTELHSAKLARGRNLVKLQDGIYQIKGKFTRARLVYADNKVNTAKI